MTMFAKIKRYCGVVVSAFAIGAAAVVPATASAALPAAVENAINGGFTDAQTAMGWMIVGFAGLFAIRLVVRLINK